MTTFDDRERAFESRFAQDEQLRFRMLARRNKALAAWAGDRMALTGEAAAAYRADILGLGFGQGGDQALAERVAADLARAGQAASPDEVRAEMDRFLAEAASSGAPL